jgi:hypothetical protein
LCGMLLWVRQVLPALVLPVLLAQGKGKGASETHWRCLERLHSSESRGKERLEWRGCRNVD